MCAEVRGVMLQCSDKGVNSVVQVSAESNRYLFPKQHDDFTFRQTLVLQKPSLGGLVLMLDLRRKQKLPCARHKGGAVFIWALCLCRKKSLVMI